jgi:ribosomal protein S14
MSRIAHHDEEVGAGGLQPCRHAGKRRTGILRAIHYCRLPIRHLGVVIDDHADVILVGLSAGQGNHLRHEVDSRIGTHAAQHADNTLEGFHNAERWNISIRARPGQRSSRMGNIRFSTGELPCPQE